MSSAQGHHLPIHPANNPSSNPSSNPSNNPSSFDGAGFAPTAGTTHHRPPSANYFSYPGPDMAVQDQTLSNTMANAHIASSVPADNHHFTNRQPKFNEEWDSSVRGSSIVDGPSTTQHIQQQQPQRQRSQSPNVQRANSISSRSEMITSDGTNSHGISLSRGNTLKKKNSLRRSASLKRSNSRRSMRAGSVRSLALQSSHEPDEIHSAFYCPVPTSGSPTELLAQRFQGM